LNNPAIKSVIGGNFVNLCPSAFASQQHAYWNSRADDYQTARHDARIHGYGAALVIGSREAPREDELAIFDPLRKQIRYFFYDLLARLFAKRCHGARCSGCWDRNILRALRIERLRNWNEKSNLSRSR
jgi:hypothetical protein